MIRRRAIGNRFAWTLIVLVLAGSRSPARMQQPARTFDLPSPGQETEQSLAPGDSDEWRVDLAAHEFLDVALDPLAVGESDQWPSVIVVGPDGVAVYESNEPNIAPGLDSWARMVVSFIAEHAGPYRVRVVARASPVRYRLALEQRRFSVDSDRQRLAAYGLWREGMRRFTQGSPDSLRASIGKFEEALAVLAAIEDHQGEAKTLGTIAAVRYQLSDAAGGKAAASRALDIWRRLGREREEGIALSDLGLLAYLAYDHASARSYYDQALVKHRASGDVLSEARTLTRVGWVQYAAAELQKAIETNQAALPLPDTHVRDR